MNNKTRVAIICGGQSAEHKVSLMSAKNVIAAIDNEKYEPILIGINTDGSWLLLNRQNFLINSEDPKNVALNIQNCKKIAILPGSKGIILDVENGNTIDKIDVIFPVLHGPYGEDGTIQGLLKLAGVPFVGSGVLGSAVGMDKDVMKRLLREAGLPIGKFITLKNQKLNYSDVVSRLGLPFFVKPANMGSSIGVSKVSNESEYESAVTEAYLHDNKIILEEYIDGREIECAVLGNDNPQSSMVGEIISNKEFYSYESKYIDSEGATLEAPAKISDEILQKVKDLSIKAFNCLEAEGLARVDFFLKEKGELVINEINTLPGFTSISMYPRLWEISGISYSDLIDRLITLALEKSKS